MLAFAPPLQPALDDFRLSVDEDMEVSPMRAFPDDEVPLLEVLNQSQTENLVDHLIVQPFEDVHFLEKIGMGGFFSDDHGASPGMK